MQLTRIIIKDLEMDKKWIQAILSNIDKLAILISLHEEPGEILVTLLMKDEEIKKAVGQAVKEVLGDGVEISEISINPDGRTIRFLISNCS